MIPILYDQTEAKFSSMGLGYLTDSISCLVTEERNGSYELEMTYPASGIHFADLQLRRLILAKPNYYDDPQPFRIYAISKPLDGIVTVNCRHISYDLSGYVCTPFTALGIQQALSGLTGNSISSCPFNFSSTRSTAAAFNVTVPSSIRSCMGGKTGSLLDIYGGEYHYNKFNISLENSRGEDRGVVIRYGKNLTELKQEENCSNVYTGVIGYYASADGTVIQGHLVNVEGTFDFTKIITADFSQDFQTVPTIAQIDEKTASYIKSNNVGVPEVNLTVSFIQHDTSDNTDYLTDNSGVFLTTNTDNILISYQKGVNTAVNLCDTVTIYFEKYGINATAKCIKTIWDVLLDSYDSVEIGDAKSSISSTISDIQKKTDTAVEYSAMDKAILLATQLITGNKGGFVVMRDSDGDGFPDEIDIMDAPNVNDSQKIWRWNKEGLGYSSTGYTGNFGTAITSDGHIVANFMDVGELNGAILKAGVIQDKTGVNYWDLDNGIFHMGLSEYFTVQPDGSVMIGNDTASMKLVMSADKISFYDNGIEVAYITNKEMHIASAEFFTALNIDNGIDSDGYYQFHMRSNGHLSLNYINK